MIIDEDAEKEDQPDGWIRGGEVGIQLSQGGHCGGSGDVPGVDKELEMGSVRRLVEGKDLRTLINSSTRVLNSNSRSPDSSSFFKALYADSLVFASIQTSAATVRVKNILSKRNS